PDSISRLQRELKAASDEACGLANQQQILKRDATTETLHVSQWTPASIERLKTAIFKKQARLTALITAVLTPAELEKQVEALRFEELPALEREEFQRDNATQPWQRVG